MHELSSTRPLLCGEMVDRVHELHEIHEAFERAAQGRPQLVLVAGEAGLGKTKLCRAFMQFIQARQTSVLFGQAIPQDQALPFGPFLDALRRFFAAGASTLPAAQASLQASLASVLKLFPVLASMLPGSNSLSAEVDAQAVQSQQAVFHGLLSTLQELARSSSGPLLLVLEDLHWADETSLELLAFLAQRLDVNNTSPTSTPQDQHTGILILGTYRADALPDNPALSRLVSQLQAKRHAYPIHLVPLNAGDHRRCVNSILGQPVPAEFANFLFDWDEGNPFFIEELLGSMVATGHLQRQAQGWLVSAGTKPHLPSSLTDAILKRFTGLPDTDQEVLAYAAVIGRVFDFPLLAALSGLDEYELVRTLRRAKNVQLISELSNTQPSTPAIREEERYQFRHALTREAIYDQMMAPERRLRHRAVAETLEKLTTIGPHATLATSTRSLDDVSHLLVEHYWLAGLLDKARPYALHEAERARRIFAFREERYYLHMAQASLPDDSPERFLFLQRMGMLSLGIYDFDGALHWLNLAKAGYQRIGQHHQALQVMANLLLINWFVASPSLPDLLAEVKSAAEAAFADPDPAGRDVETLVAASLLAHYWTVHSLYTRATRWIERCFALFEALDDPRKVPAIQLSYMTRAWFKAHRRSQDFEEGWAEIRQAIDRANQFSLPDVIMIGYALLAWMLISWGWPAEAEQVLKKAASFEERSGTLQPLFLLGWQRFFSGDRWEQGMEELRQGIERLLQLRVSYLAAVTRVALAHLLLTRNELEEADMQMQAARPVLAHSDEYIYHMPLWWGFARLHRARDESLQAQEWFERILKRWKTTEDMLTIIPVLLDGISFYVESGELMKARQWLAELKALMRDTDNPVGAAALLQAQGMLSAAEGALEEAIAPLRRAVDAWGNMRWRYYQALASQRLAEVLLEKASKQSTSRAMTQAAREEAEELLAKALTIYENLRVPTGIEAVQRLRASTHLEAQRKRRQTLEMRHHVERLTERERQVLLQLATGRTNREIAATLHISSGTVELHVTHILAKLGCETRTQAAAYAIARGWVKQPKSF